MFKKKKQEETATVATTSTDISSTLPPEQAKEEKKSGFFSRFKRKEKTDDDADTESEATKGGFFSRFKRKKQGEDAENTETGKKKKQVEPSRDSILVAALVGGILALVIVDSLLFNDSTSDRYAGFLTLITLLVGIFGSFTVNFEARWMGRLLNIMGVLQLIIMGVLLYFQQGNPVLVVAINVFFALALFFAAMLFRRDVQLEEAGLRIFRK